MSGRINLCAENGYGQLSTVPFGDRFSRYAIRDHNACSLGSRTKWSCPAEQINSIMGFIQDWFNRDGRNVVAVHCKGGKGRTGMIICCLLL